MKKFLFLIVILLLALGAGCKKKEVVVEAPPPPPPPPKQTEQEYMKGFIRMVPVLELGEVTEVQIDKSRVISEENSFSVSLFPLEFLTPAEKPYVIKYLFPSVVWRYDDFQLPIVDLENYFTCTEPGDKIWIIKESPNPTKPFEQVPTLLVETSEGKFWILDQDGDEMLKREDWGK